MINLQYSENGFQTASLSFSKDKLLSHLKARPSLISIVPAFSKDREAVEQFIKTIFAGAYGARIDVHYPILMSVRDEAGKILAATGFRPATTDTLLQNPFYYGVMKVKGQLYPHTYEPLISKDIFDQCQSVRIQRSQRRTVSETKHPYLLRGLIGCAVSGRAVTCDLKKKKYVYLICRDPKNPAKKLWVKESDVIEQIETALKSIRISSEHLKKIKPHIKKTLASQRAHKQAEIVELNKEREAIYAQIDKLTDLLISNKITQDAHSRKHTQLQQRTSEIDARLNEQSENSHDIEKAIFIMLSLCNRALDIFKSSKTAQKRSLLRTVFSNFELNAQNLSWALVSPLSEMVEVVDYKEWLGWHIGGP